MNQRLMDAEERLTQLWDVASEPAAYGAAMVRATLEVARAINLQTETQEELHLNASMERQRAIPTMKPPDAEMLAQAVEERDRLTAQLDELIAQESETTPEMRPVWFMARQQLEDRLKHATDFIAHIQKQMEADGAPQSH